MDLDLDLDLDWFAMCRFVIVGGGNAAGYAARTFVEHGMADGRLCIVSKEVCCAG